MFIQRRLSNVQTLNAKKPLKDHRTWRSMKNWFTKSWNSLFATSVGQRCQCLGTWWTTDLNFTVIRSNQLQNIEVSSHLESIHILRLTHPCQHFFNYNYIVQNILISSICFSMSPSLSEVRAVFSFKDVKMWKVQLFLSSVLMLCLSMLQIRRINIERRTLSSF